jgi:hypothetical protein
VDQDEKRKLDNMLMTMELSGISDPALLDQLAMLISIYPGDKHRFFEDLLANCEADKRYECYQAMAPRLQFQALPLSDYEARIRNRVSDLASHRKIRIEGRAPHPIEVEGKKYAAVPEAEADAVVATLKCSCGKTAHYLAGTPASAMIAARRNGWVRDPGTKKEVCKACHETSKLGVPA